MPVDVMKIPQRKFPRGAILSPRYKLLAATPHRINNAVPTQIAYVPKVLQYWGNDSYGDCFDELTEVLTDRGWVNWKNYNGNDSLATVNQDTLLLEFQKPLAVIQKEYEGLMYYGNHRGNNFLVTPNHRFYLRPYRIKKNGREYIPGASGYGAFKFCTAQNFPSRFLIPGASSGFLGTRIDKLTIGSRQWDGTDFIRLLALIISDGYTTSENAKAHHDRSSFCCFREDRLDMVRSFAYKLGIREDSSKPGVWIIYDIELANWLRHNIYIGTGNSLEERAQISDAALMNCFNNCLGETLERKSPYKKIPDLVKWASQDQIEEFLRFYGDQSFSNGRDFYTTSYDLAGDLQEVLLRTGKRANINKREPRTGGTNDKGTVIQGNFPEYSLHVWEDSDVTFVRSKNIETDYYKGNVYCATVPNSTLITRRNGDILVSGNCVTAEEAFAKACYNVMFGGPEILISDSEVESWARSNGYLNGADLSSVIESMEKSGFQVGSQLYNDGPYTSVDYSNESILQSAIAQGPVKIAIDASALPSGAGNSSGWYSTSHSNYGNTDHCVSLAGFGSAGWLYQQLGVSLPSGLSATTLGYLLFTWSTIGFVDHGWLMGTCQEAWVRNPTTIGVPPLVVPVITPPSFISANSVTFTANVPGSFTVKTTGSPVPSIIAQGCNCFGVQLTDNKDGTATLTSLANSPSGNFIFNIIASNGTDPQDTVTQVFTLSIGAPVPPAPPVITSPNSANFIIGSASNSFTITTTGNPTPNISSTILPQGLTLTDNKNGTATLSADNSLVAGKYVFTIIAASGSVAVAQDFTLTVTSPIPVSSQLLVAKQIPVGNYLIGNPSNPIGTLSTQQGIPPGTYQVNG